MPLEMVGGLLSPLLFSFEVVAVNIIPTRSHQHVAECGQSIVILHMLNDFCSPVVDFPVKSSLKKYEHSQ